MTGKFCQIILFVFLQDGNVLDSVPDATLNGHSIFAVEASQFDGELRVERIEGGLKDEIQNLANVEIRIYWSNRSRLGRLIRGGGGIQIWKEFEVFSSLLSEIRTKNQLF